MEMKEEQRGKHHTGRLWVGYSVHDDLYPRARLPRFSKSQLVPKSKRHSIHWLGVKTALKGVSKIFSTVMAQSSRGCAVSPPGLLCPSARSACPGPASSQLRSASARDGEGRRQAISLSFPLLWHHLLERTCRSRP